MYKENTARLWRFLHMCFNISFVFSEKVKILSAHSETILCTANNPNFVVFFMYTHLNTFCVRLKNFPILFHRRLNTVGIFSDYQKELRIRRRNCYFQQCLTKLKGQHFEKIKIGDHKQAYAEKMTKLLVMFDLLSAYS